MNRPKLTVGMAHCDDFEGLWSTVQSVFLHNDWKSPTDVEIVIVDTSPTGSEHRRLVRDFVEKGGHNTPGSRTPLIKYVDMAGYAGTTFPRDRVFNNASGEYVVCMDCHVMLRHNSLLKLVEWFDKNPDCQDLIHGPMLYDNLDIVSTHFTDQFRGGMWGTWGSAWSTPDGTVFMTSNEEFNDEYKDEARKKFDGCKFFDIMTLEEFKPGKNGDVVFPCGHVLPSNLPWYGHDKELVKFSCFPCMSFILFIFSLFIFLPLFHADLPFFLSDIFCRASSLTLCPIKVSDIFFLLTIVTSTRSLLLNCS
jgi:hypothetical protein